MIKGYANLQGTMEYFSKQILKDTWSVITDRYRYSILGLGTFNVGLILFVAKI